MILLILEVNYLEVNHPSCPLTVIVAGSTICHWCPAGLYLNVTGVLISCIAAASFSLLGLQQTTQSRQTFSAEAAMAKTLLFKAGIANEGMILL